MECLILLHLKMEISPRCVCGTTQTYPLRVARLWSFWLMHFTLTSLRAYNFIEAYLPFQFFREALHECASHREMSDQAFRMQITQSLDLQTLQKRSVEVVELAVSRSHFSVVQC